MQGVLRPPLEIVKNVSINCHPHSLEWIMDHHSRFFADMQQLFAGFAGNIAKFPATIGRFLGRSAV
jgi:hypothetical protein